ncbi:MAG: HPP family protein [Edaphobacter sp.]
MSIDNQGLPQSNFSHVGVLVERLRLPFLLKHFPKKAVWSAYVCINGFLTIALLALLGELTHSPFVFPSLGPTAYLFFFSPLAETSCPRNTILGHGVGLLCGFAAFWLTGMHTFTQATDSIYWPRIFAAALALSFTGAIMVFLSVSHPPAGATTLIVALGILSKPHYLVVIEAAVILLTLQAWILNHLAGLPYPKWAYTKPEV